MLWFNKSKRQLHKEEDLVSAERSSVEIVAHKRATKRTVAQVNKVNRDLNRVFAQNGITLQIKIAVGGKH